VKSYLHQGVWASVLVCASLLAAVSCGSDDDKKVNRDEDAGGQGGAGAPSSAGTPSTEGGTGGAPTPEGGTGNAGGDPTQPVAGGGGAGGEPTEMGGAGGQPPVSSCVPEGATLLPNVVSEPIYSVCRGARLAVPMSAEGTDASFTCCGVSNAEPAWGTDFFGRSYVEFGREFLFEVATDAPLGAQSMSIECQNGPVGGVVQLNVVEGAPPVVTSATEQVVQGDVITVEGTNLNNVSDAWAIAPDGSSYECIIDGEGQDDASFTCFFNGIPIGTGYRLRISQEGCGLAAVQPEFEVLPPPA
jgi:hypothetical protein